MRVISLGFVAGLVLIVAVHLLGGGIIATAIGAGLVLGGYLLNLRSWSNLSEKESIKKPLAGSIVLASLVIAAIGGSPGDGFVSNVLTGFGGTGLLLVMYLAFKHFGPDFRASK